jgi:hypothetical protein
LRPDWTTYGGTYTHARRVTEALLELRLAALWEELLGVGPVGPDDDFFALGGSSLLAGRLVLRIAADFGARVAVRDFYLRPTVRATAQLIRQSTPVG